MIDAQNLIRTTMRATFEQGHPRLLNDTPRVSHLCAAADRAAAFLTTSSIPYESRVCRTSSSRTFLFSSSSCLLSSSFAEASPRPGPLSPPSVPRVSSSLLSYIVSREEPLYFCNFDLNPNTSAFLMTFISATVLQIAGFYLLRALVPRLGRSQPKDKRSLSWVLTLFSSIVLFTGTFMLSSHMEWSRNAGFVEPLLSLRNFPNESEVSTMYSAYFVSYLSCDLVLGMIYYRAFLDPLSGWFHHLAYLAVVSHATSQKNVSTLFAMGTPIEGTALRL